MATSHHHPPGHKQREEAFAKRSVFYVNVEWEAGAKPADFKHVQGQMYVECLEPLAETEAHPIILIHGDYHSSQIWLTKPDNQPGWASFFVNNGYRVYLVDLPSTGRCNSLHQNYFTHGNPKGLSAGYIEQEITAPEKSSNDCGGPRWPTAMKHDKWPGHGIRGDPIFNSYCASLMPLFFSTEARQTLAQNALKALLEQVGESCVLVGEGSGATAAWLAADVVPHLVSGVAALEPPGPPFCTPRTYDTYSRYDPNRLKYGLASIPLTYDPPVHASLDFEAQPAARLDLAVYQHQTTEKKMILQRGARAPNGFKFVEHITPLDRPTNVRKLINLQKMPHAVFTGEASSHSGFDEATMHFMIQAGLRVSCGILQRYGIHGNGHLMFLETNSDEIAAMLTRWIQKMVENRNDVPHTPNGPSSDRTLSPPIVISPVSKALEWTESQETPVPAVDLNTVNLDHEALLAQLTSQEAPPDTKIFLNGLDIDIINTYLREEPLSDIPPPASKPPIGTTDPPTMHNWPAPATKEAEQSWNVPTHSDEAVCPPVSGPPASAALQVQDPQDSAAQYGVQDFFGRPRKRVRFEEHPPLRQDRETKKDKPMSPALRLPYAELEMPPPALPTPLPSPNIFQYGYTPSRFALSLPDSPTPTVQSWPAQPEQQLWPSQTQPQTQQPTQGSVLPQTAPAYTWISSGQQSAPSPRQIPRTMWQDKPDVDQFANQRTGGKLQKTDQDEAEWLIKTYGTH